MRLKESDMARIICGSQDHCVHRKEDGKGGRCGDCCIPAHLIFALENGAEIDPDRLDGNQAAEALVKQRWR